MSASLCRTEVTLAQNAIGCDCRQTLVDEFNRHADNATQLTDLVDDGLRGRAMVAGQSQRKSHDDDLDFLLDHDPTNGFVVEPT
jgi:hypothetical protein